MKTDSPNGTSISKIKHRLVLPIQTRGSLGKSTEAIIRAEWMRQHRVPWKGYDLDVYNRTLSETYPEEVILVEPSREPVSDIIKILRKVNQVAVTMIDPQAHMNKTILSAIAQIDFPKFAVEAQARATVLIFPIDEVSDMEDISETVDTLGDSVDWIIVRNRERIPTTKFFDGSALEKQLQGFKARYLDLPPLLTDTRNHLRGSQLKLGRTLSPAEAISNPSLEIDAVHRVLFQKWVAEVFRRLDAVGSYLVPDEYAETIKPGAEVRPDKAHRRAAGINLENIL
jgi:hypothetical protein